MTGRLVRSTLMTAMVIAGLGSAFAPGAVAGGGDRGRFVYTTRVLCGFSGSTTINVHNPNAWAIRLTKKGIALEPGSAPAAPQGQPQETLEAGWALLIGCDDLAGLNAVGSSGAGDLVFESRHPLDVWATYTSIVAGGGIGETRVVPVPGTRLGR